MKLFKSLRSKLFFWYATSLISVTVFFYLAVHFYSLPYNNLIFLGLLCVLALEGWLIVRHLTNELTKLSAKIKTITSLNLQEKIADINSDDEIGELASSFNQLLDRLDEAFKRERQFIGDVAHELKTPVTTLNSQVELILTKPRTQKQYHAAFSDMHSDINRLSRTIQNILDLAWIGAENVVVNKKHFNLSQVLTDLTDIAAKLAAPKHLHLITKIDTDIKVIGIEERIFRALLNIIDNAVKYTQTGGTVTINLHRQLDQAVIKVKDTGIGIASVDRPHIFDRFYRGGKTRRTVGSGLGLAIAQGIITAHQGKIKVASSIGQGTTVSVSLPTHPPSS